MLIIIMHAIFICFFFAIHSKRALAVDKCYFPCSNPEDCLGSDFKPATNYGCTFCCKHFVNATAYYLSYDDDPDFFPALLLFHQSVVNVIFLFVAILALIRQVYHWTAFVKEQPKISPTVKLVRNVMVS
jgi:hypothetical protein